MHRSSMIRGFATLAVLALMAAACGTGGGGGGGDDERTVIRFAFAPDPVWDYMNDNGVIVKWEEENNVRIVTTSTWDEFTFFAGGHGDVISIGTQEIPVLEQETDIETVTFGKYNAQRSPMIRRAGDPYEELPDVAPGSTICVSSAVSNTQFWSVAMNELHGIDYRVGGGDYNLIINDHFVNPQNLLNGDCEAAVIIPEAAAPYLRTGELELMYGGEMPFQLYNRFSGFESEEAHVMSNLFTATKEFYEAHPDEMAAFLGLWQQGIELWEQNQKDIIATYPQHFSVEDDADIQFIADFMAGPNDWFVDSVYFTDEWVQSERKIWDFMTELHPDNQNYLEPGFAQPRFEVIAAP
ncbi:MAG: ABC transporter substrate-binding protein [Acidimicrobiia bacterium]|nr:ABC transporter substrate-binding protein [Acidimicrobiia bacterium]